jgi:WD40 repeat protein
LTKPPPAGLLFSSEGLRYAPNGQLLAAAHPIASEAEGRSAVDIFNPKTGEIEHKIADEPLGGTYSKIEFSPDGKLLVRTFDSSERSRIGQFMVHRTDTWEVIWSLNTMPLCAHTLALSKDGKLAAVSGLSITQGGGRIRGKPNWAQILIIDLEQRKVIRSLDQVFPPNAAVEIVAWHPDGIHLAAGANGSSINGADPPPEPVKVFDTRTGEAVVVEPTHPATIMGLRYTSDGKYLIESGYPRMARIWDGQHQTLLQEIAVKESFALAISDNNRYLALGDGPHVSIWELK